MTDELATGNVTKDDRGPHPARHDDRIARSKACSIRLRSKDTTRTSNTTIAGRRTFPSARRPRRSARRFCLESTTTSTDRTVHTVRFLPKVCPRFKSSTTTTLMKIMREYFDGDCLRVVEKGRDRRCEGSGHRLPSSTEHSRGDLCTGGRLQQRAWAVRCTRFSRRFGIYPNNAIVGGSADISVGAALFKHVNRKPGIVIGNIGDASAGCGPTWEALCFATMDQFKELWDENHRGGLPLIMNFVNNFYGMGGQPVAAKRWVSRCSLAWAAGLTPDQMHAERIDGYNPPGGRRRDSPQEGDHRPR